MEFSSVVEFAAVMLMGAIAGTMVGLKWATSKLSPKQFVEVLQLILPPLSKWFPPLCIAAVAVLIVLLLAGEQTNTDLLLQFFTLISLIGFMFITVRGNVPINMELAKWHTNKLPGGWEHKMNRWHSYNNLRFILITAGFTALIISVV